MYVEFGIPDRGFRTADVQVALGAIAGRDFAPFFTKFVAGTARLPGAHVDVIDHETNAIADHGNPPVKTTFTEPLPPGYLDFDEVGYHVFPLVIHGTRVIVAVHRSLDGVTAIGGVPTPTKEDFAQQVFDMYDDFRHVFGGHPDDRLVVKVQALSDPNRFIGASRMGWVVSAAGLDLACRTCRPHGYTVPTFLTGHETFHIWNGRLIMIDAPESSVPVPFFEETFFVEGFTYYYDARGIHATGHPEEYARMMHAARDRYLAIAGTEQDVSFAEMAARANASGCCPPPPSIFQDLLAFKGALVGYLLDQELTALGKSLDDLMRFMYEEFGLRDRRFRTRDLVDALRRITGTDFQPFFTRFVSGTERLPVDASLDFIERPVATPPRLIAAVLPGSRAVTVGTPATVFATVINSGGTTATAVRVSLRTSIPATLSAHAADPRTNAVTGGANTPVDIPAGGSQSFLLAITPTAPFPPTRVEFAIAGTNTSTAPTIAGVSTLLLAASSAPVPDVVALAATPTADGIASVAGIPGTTAFSVATVNLGVSGRVAVTPDLGGVALPVSLAVCETNPTLGTCAGPAGTSVVTEVAANATPTFAVFVGASAPTAFDPGTNRVHVRFLDGAGVVRGATSVAVRTLP
jgi:hypothetical protein